MHASDWLALSGHVVIILIFLALWAQIRGLRLAIELLTALIEAMDIRLHRD